MAELYGRRYTRAELLQRVGRLDQIGGIEPCILDGGRAAGVHALRVTTGAGLDFTVLPDRCLDIPHAPLQRPAAVLALRGTVSSARSSTSRRATGSCARSLAAC